jgi:hypothetical protein
VVNVIDEESRQQDQDEDTTHTFLGAYLNVFGIQTIFLVEAIGMFDLRAKAPLGIYGLTMLGGVNREIGDQDQIAVQVWVVGDQHPQCLLCLGQSDLEPSELDVYAPRLASVSESRLQGEGERERSGQIVQQPRFPAIQALVVDLHLAIVAHPKDELALDPVHLAKDLLIIHPGVPHKAHQVLGEQGARDADGAIDLPVFAYKVSRHVGKPIPKGLHVGIRHHRLWQLDHRGGHRWVARGQAFLILRPGRRTLQDGGNPFQFFRLRLLQVHRVQGDDQERGSMVRHHPLRHAIQALQQVSMTEALVPDKSVQAFCHRSTGFPLARYPLRHLGHSR